MNTESSRSREVLESAAHAIISKTGLQVQADAKPKSRHGPVDAWIRVRREPEDILFAAQVKAVDRFQTPAQVKAHLERVAPNHRPLLVAPYITMAVAENCRALHLSFVDTAGNAFLEAPGLYVYVIGQPRPTMAARSSHRSLEKSGLQIIFALLANPSILRQPYRVIAQAAGVALGTVTPVIRDLEERGFLREKPARRVLDPQKLLEEWVTHYPITLRPKLALRRYAADPERLQSADLREADANWGGEKAAEKLTGYLRPGFFTIYAHPPARRLITALHLRAEPDGNVEVLNRFWEFRPDSEFPDLVPPILVYADLMASGNGRNMEAAKIIHEQRIKPAFEAFAALA